ncbi:MAG TPA: type III-B CRISPR module-associated protein Cmr5 [Methylomusa anaerophila]|uniref:CRISPR type III-B/RAMP module-associated protein Cmr5 n=1 Tax=Methylomusa anaerophila TaxID=1930071 RepID=A0A348ALW7_9FIRM|nr:type III-B CRISPR module-associated protein Cmr5 [Methylomusa anaerophila]BBB92065.1 CRISPR-associated protein [Methylomusa anaerophila]HML87923.1 type III-B CRISPR module-associated protein Cmr5 [Methylomusa anaerophila]
MIQQINSIKGLEMGRASFAYEKVEDAVEKLTKNDAKKYKSYVKKIPMYIKTNGLGPTLAFIRSKTDPDPAKSDTVYAMIYNQTTQWLKQDPKRVIIVNNDLVKTIISLRSPEYRAATVEVLSLFNWLRRFAEGLIEGEADDDIAG